MYGENFWGQGVSEDSNERKMKKKNGFVDRTCIYLNKRIYFCLQEKH